MFYQKRNNVEQVQNQVTFQRDVRNKLYVEIKNQKFQRKKKR